MRKILFALMMLFPLAGKLHAQAVRAGSLPVTNIVSQPTHYVIWVGSTGDSGPVRLMSIDNLLSSLNSMTNTLGTLLLTKQIGSAELTNLVNNISKVVTNAEAQNFSIANGTLFITNQWATNLIGAYGDGFIARSGNSPVVRTHTGTVGEISVANGNGVSGNPTYSLDPAVTRDVEWDTIAEIETVTGGVNILLATEVDTDTEFFAIMTGFTGSGNAVRATSPTIVTPTIADLSNMTHNHQNAAGGGALDAAAITSGTFATARIADNAITGAKIAMGSDAQGDVLFYNGTDYARLGPGSAGQFLETQGAGANPRWGTPAGSGSGFPLSADANANDNSITNIKNLTINRSIRRGITNIAGATPVDVIVAGPGWVKHDLTNNMVFNIVTNGLTLTTEGVEMLIQISTTNSPPYTVTFSNNVFSIAGNEQVITGPTNCFFRFFFDGLKGHVGSVHGRQVVSDVAFASSWNGDGTNAPSKNSVYDWGHIFDTDDDGKVNVVDLAAAGFPAVDASGVIQASRTMTGTANEITVTDGNGASGNPTFAIHAAITRDTEWDTLAEINTATTDEDAVGTTRTLTVSGTTFEVSLSAGAQDLSANRTWTVSYDRTARLAGDPAFTGGSLSFGTNGIVFEGLTGNTSEGLLMSSDVTADRTWTLPDATGTVVLEDNTATLTGKTVDASATGNVLKFKSFLWLKGPDLVQNGGMLPNTNDVTAVTFGKVRFSNSADEASNYAEYHVMVPEDIDTAVDLRARVIFRLTGADTGTHRYVLSLDDVANSGAYTGTVGNAVNLDFAGDGSGASGDVESVGLTTLTGWAGAMTAGRHLVIRIARDGNATEDGSTVDSDLSIVGIEYGVTQ
jgi:hypothetical protein